MALRRFPEAVQKLDQILNITPDDIDTLVVKAAIAQAEGDSAAGRVAPRSAPSGRRRPARGRHRLTRPSSSAALPNHPPAEGDIGQA